MAPTSYKWSYNLHEWSYNPPYNYIVGAHLEGKGYNLLATFLWTGHFLDGFPKNTLHESQIKLKSQK